MDDLTCVNDWQTGQSILQQAAGDGGSGVLASGLSSQSTLVKAGIYGLSFMYVLLHIPIDAQACKAQFLLGLGCLDSLLLFGHLWDRVPNLQVVLNCRFTYICLASVLNAGIFLVWSDCAAVPFMSTQNI